MASSPVLAWLDRQTDFAEDERSILREALWKHRVNTVDVLIDLSDKEILRVLKIKSLGTRKTFRFELRKLRTSMGLPPDPVSSFCFGWFSRPIIVARISAPLKTVSRPPVTAVVPVVLGEDEGVGEVKSKECRYESD